MTENISLFETGEYSNRIDVVKMDFLEAETVSWRELFQGFQKLHAITYSSGIGFICDLLDLFEYSEIIFGNQDVMSYQMQEILAFQLKTIEWIKEASNKMQINLISKIENRNLELFVSREQLSHEKIYLLESVDGRKRTIFGSANMSRAAFNGFQRENIGYIDGEKAFTWYMESFKRLKENCSDNITTVALAVANDNENADEIPVFKTVTIKKSLIVEPQTNLKDEIRFGLDIKNLANRFSPYMPKADSKGRTLLSPQDGKIIRNKLIDFKKKEKEVRSEYPQLVIDVDSSIVTLNDTAYDLNPHKQEIKQDVELFVQYMSGYERFHGDVKGMQSRYYEFANWFFVSPFMGTMRDMAIRYNHNTLPYPVFGLLYGQSKAGKTSFLETLLIMMIGQKPKISAPDFTRSSIEGLKNKVLGVPIVVDDLTQSRFNQHAIETIKNDDFGISNNLKHYPAVVISANEDVKAVAPEITRRTIICRVQAGLTNTELMRDSTVRRVQQKVGTSLYREYLREMLGLLPSLINELKGDDSENAPDILAVSSKVLLKIVQMHFDGEIPFYLRELTLDDYFSEKVTGAHARKTIKDAWHSNRNAFVVKRKENILEYNAAQTWEADRIIKELPEDLEATKVRECVVMDLNRASEFFEVDFMKRSFFDFFRNR